MEVNAICGLIVPNSSSTSSSYFVQLDSKAHTVDYVLTSCQRSTSTMSSLSSRSATSSGSNDSSECTVKGTSSVLQSSQSTSKHSRSLRIHYVTTKRHADCQSMERYLKGRPNTILKQSKFNRHRSKKYEYRCCICGCEFRLLVIVDDSNGGIYETRETSIPESHDPISEMVPRHHRMDKQVSMLIVQMLEQNQFTKNFGPKRIISELRR
jgi:hypothetical protein